MKNHLLSSIVDNLCNSVFLKLFMVLSWLSIIGAAGNYDILLEVYLLTMLVGIVAYAICNIYSTKGSRQIINTTTQINHAPPKENYLDVFRASNQKDYQS